MTGRRSSGDERPVIGITTYAEQARWGAWDLPAALLPLAYVQAVADAGGAPVLVPPLGDAVAPALSVLDGLLLAGGADLAPASYGAAPHPQTTGTRPERDASELALLAAALERELPVLGVCRGMQLLNVALGGTLVQHLPDVVGHEGHRGPPGVFAEHEVRLEPGSRLARALDGTVAVRSYHHQGVDRVAGALRAVGWAPDGAVEALEHDALPFAVGVLWHPEAGEDPRIFRALVDAAREPA
jgi:gamma-glutamyl-gamma-aminobutyrate hydrolase PuuD